MQIELAARAEGKEVEPVAVAGSKRRQGQANDDADAGSASRQGRERAGAHARPRVFDTHELGAGGGGSEKRCAACEERDGAAQVL